MDKEGRKKIQVLASSVPKKEEAKGAAVGSTFAKARCNHCTDSQIA
jgi:hypothetical protein